MTIQLLTIVFGTLASEDLTAIAAGVLVARGDLPFIAAAAACSAGIWIGDLGLWLAGRVAGSRVLRWRRVAAVLSREDVVSFRARLDRHAPAVMFGSRFVPGSRLPLYVAAGACGFSFRQFALWSLAAASVWTPALVGIVAVSGESARIHAALTSTSIALPVFAVLIFGVSRVGLLIASTRGRQRAAAAIARIWRWEFWPTWLFYAPVAAWVCLLAIRYRGFRTITASNPGIADGGVAGESKFEISSRLPEAWTIPALLVEPGGFAPRLEIIRSKIEQRGWSLPLILKPDVGQRGSGVRLVHDWRAIADYVKRAPGRIIVQPYHPGPFEAGLFYYRIPGAAQGRILCITDKHFPVVTGDGHATLEDLIWRHPRYRMQARTFLATLHTRRNDVPAAGELVPLGIAGNHAQGALFTDGSRLLTPALEARIDDIARGFPGFYIGRFDVRYSDPEAFIAGQDLAIVELNGATAECTNIYDPSRTLLAAYRQLFEQWLLVFKIGAINRASGAQATSTRRLLALVRAHCLSDPPLAVGD